MVTTRPAVEIRAVEPPPAPGAAGRNRSRRRRHDLTVAWLFLTPALVLFGYFKFIPMGQGIWMSFHEVRPYLGDQWVGLRNYADVLSSEQFTKAVWQTIALATGQAGGAITVGLLLALLVEGQARHLWIVRTAAFLPFVTTMAVVAEVWRIMYHPSDGGTLNTVLGYAGLGPYSYLSHEDSALWSVMGVLVWRNAPYDMMIILAGLAGVDRTLYEQAAVDGAGIWRRLRHITLPALRPVFAILVILHVIRGLRIFTEVFLLTNGAPNGSTEVMMTLIYKLGLERGELGVAAAGSVVLFAATAVLTALVYRARRAD